MPKYMVGLDRFISLKQMFNLELISCKIFDPVYSEPLFQLVQILTNFSIKESINTYTFDIPLSLQHKAYCSHFLPVFTHYASIATHPPAIIQQVVGRLYPKGDRIFIVNRGG